MMQFSTGDKVRFRLSPSGLGALARVIRVDGVEIIVETVPERRWVSVYAGDLNAGWGNSDERDQS